MEKVEEKKYWEIFFNSELNIFEVIWLQASVDMEEEEFMEYLLGFINLVKKYKVTGFLTDARQNHITISLELQEWHDKTIVPQYIENGICKIVFVVSEEALVAMLSIEQTFEEKQAMTLDTQFTDSMEKGRAMFI